MKRKFVLITLLILVVVSITSVIAYKVYAAYTITLTDLKMKSIGIYRCDVTTGDPPVITTEIAVDLYSILYNGDGYTESKRKTFTLTPAQKAHFVNDFKPLVQQAATEYDVNPPAWAAP